MQIISVSIDLNKIDKSKIKPHANGAKYYPMTITVFDEKDQYDNDVSVTDSQTKEQREANEKKSYLGNGRVVFKKSGNASSNPDYSNSNPGNATNAPNDDLPF